MHCDDFEMEAGPAFKLRTYQQECIEAVTLGWATFSRLLAVLATGCGKTVIFSMIALREVQAGGRVLILAHTDELLEQAIDKIRRATGLEADKEKADSHASPYAQVVVASIQTLSRTNRLTGFADNHFSLVICDETHRALAKSYQKVLSYFHFGAQSLAEGWKMPAPEVSYRHKARCLGVTATPDRADKRSLGEFYQKCVYDYGLLEACRDGYLVRPIVKQIPLKLDLRGVKKTAGDYDAGQIVERITPFLNTIAEYSAPHMLPRKSVFFMPSVDTSRIMAEALCRHGIDATFVSGNCSDRKEKLQAYHAKGNGSAICNAMLLTEGWDHDKVSCMSLLRVTKIRSLLGQCAGRTTRPLTGIIDGLETREERLAAIASSAKKDTLLLDFLWLTDKLDLVGPADLVTTNPVVKAAILKSGEEDLLAAEQEGQKDLLKSLEKEAKRHEHKHARTLDPIAWAVSLGDEFLAAYSPQTEQEARPATAGELDFLLQAGIETQNIKTSGQAQKFIARVIDRDKMGLASPKQLQFLKKLGMSDESASLMTKKQAGAVIGRKTASWR